MSHYTAHREYICGESLRVVDCFVYGLNWRRISQSEWELPGLKGLEPARVRYVSEPRRLMGLQGGALHVAPFIHRQRARRDFLEMAHDRRMRVIVHMDMERAAYESREAALRRNG